MLSVQADKRVRWCHFMCLVTNLLMFDHEQILYFESKLNMNINPFMPGGQKMFI